MSVLVFVRVQVAAPRIVIDTANGAAFFRYGPPEVVNVKPAVIVELHGPVESQRLQVEAIGSSLYLFIICWLPVAAVTVHGLVILHSELLQ